MQTAADRPEVSPYRAAFVPDDNTWHVLDPLGGALCCASTQDRADEVVRWLTVAARERIVDDATGEGPRGRAAPRASAC